MELIAIHPHSLKHGLTETDITCAWNSAFAWFRRDLENGGIDYVLVGLDGRSRLMELIARYCSNRDGYIIYHALVPPTRKVLREIGINREEALWTLSNSKR